MPLPANAPRAVVTGGGGGFGRALALELAPRGADLVLADVNVASAEETARLALGHGAKRARAVHCDVTKLDDVRALAELFPEGVDFVVNNAGVSSGGRIGELPIEDWRWTIDVDLFGVIHGCHVFAPILRRQGHGHILNVASAAGLLSAPQMGAYNVAKAGVIALSETLAAEMVRTKVGVTVLCPTFFRTNISARGRYVDPKLKASADRLVAHGKAPEAIARAALTSIERGELYALPMADARWYWRLKRLTPHFFPTLAGMVARAVK